MLHHLINVIKNAKKNKNKKKQKFKPYKGYIFAWRINI